MIIAVRHATQVVVDVLTNIEEFRQRRILQQMHSTNIYFTLWLCGCGSRVQSQKD